MQRYVKNPDFRSVLGLDITETDNITTILSPNDFKAALGTFLKDVVTRTVTTRNNAPQIKEYSDKLRSARTASSQPVQPHNIFPGRSDQEGSAGTTKKPARTWKRIARSDDLVTALDEIPSYKLVKIYSSLCGLALSTHTPLLVIGAWTLVESLTALDGRKSHQSFAAYLNANKLSSLGLGTRADTKAIVSAIGRLADLGNITKHDAIAAAFNGEMFSNDMDTMKRMFIALARNVKGKGS